MYPLSEEIRLTNEHIRKQIIELLKKHQCVLGCAVVGSLQFNCALPETSDVDGVVVFSGNDREKEILDKKLDKLCVDLGLKNQLCIINHETATGKDLIILWAKWYSGDKLVELKKPLSIKGLSARLAMGNIGNITMLGYFYQLVDQLDSNHFWRKLEETYGPRLGKNQFV